MVLLSWRGRKMGVRSADAAPAGREFFKGVLAAGAATPVARWSSTPDPNRRAARQLVPGDIVAKLPADPWAYLLAAHAKVMCALTSERAVVTGYVPRGA